MLDMVEEFNKLRQWGFMQAYQQRFKELKALMMISNPTLTEGYFVSSFINGLNEEIRPIVKMFQPKTIQQAMECAKLQDFTVEALTKKQKGVSKGWQAMPLQQSNWGWNKEGGTWGQSNKGLALSAPSQSFGNSLGSKGG